MAEEINAGMGPEKPKGTVNSVLGIIIFIVVIAIVAGGLWYWYKKTAPQEWIGTINFTTTSPSASASASPSISASSSPSTSPTSSVCTKEKATETVRNLSEVKTFLQQTPSGKVEYDHEDKEIKAWVVHVYGIADWGAATFNWYNVDETTCKATAMF